MECKQLSWWQASLEINVLLECYKVSTVDDIRRMLDAKVFLCKLLTSIMHTNHILLGFNTYAIAMDTSVTQCTEC
jgi:hypothetical protein